MQVQVTYRQSLLDLSIQLYGSIEEVFTLAVANNLSVTDVLPPNTVIEAPIIKVSKPTVQNYYNRKNIKPATALSSDALTILENIDPCDLCALFK